MDGAQTLMNIAVSNVLMSWLFTTMPIYVLLIIDTLTLPIVVQLLPSADMYNPSLSNHCERVEATPAVARSA